MADFRKWFSALSVTALMAVFALPTFAQGTQPFICQANAGTPPIVRAEAYNDLVGDFVLACTGGTHTAMGAIVPAANVTIFLSTNITSRLLGSTVFGSTTANFNEALLIVDEPNSPTHPTRPILNCGNSGAADNGPSGPGVCSIISNGTPSQTYDGTPNVTSLPTGYYDTPDITCGGSAITLNMALNGSTSYTPPGANSYGCGRPNVFQGRTAVAQNVGQSNSVVFSGVPLDPPGGDPNDPNLTRILRITNVRADAELTGVSSTFTTSQIQMSVSISNNASLAINNPQQIVAFVQRGLQDISVKGNFTHFIQCVAETLPQYPSGSGVNENTGMWVQFTEGFNDSWKTEGWQQMAANGYYNGSFFQYGTMSNAYPDNNPATVLSQDVPGAIYHTESGFNANPNNSPPNPDPPNGIGTATVTGGGTLHSTSGTGIDNAGLATQGTRLVMTMQDIPAGSTVKVPKIVWIQRADGTVTGVAVMVSGFDGAGAGGAAPDGASQAWVTVGANNLLVYEVLFADPFALEHLRVPVGLAYTPNLSSNQPDPTVTATVAGGFAPFYSPGPGPRSPQHDSAYPTPRFIPGQAPQDLFHISKCACNLLFPFVTNASAGDTAFDTGIAIANASLDPGASNGFLAAPQQGAVQFWYYNTASGASVATQCTNAASPGDCPGTTVVPAGGVLTYVLSQGSSDWGLDNRAAGFTGYMIAQAQFQYCHAFAYISAQGAGPTSPGMSVGYLGLVMDDGGSYNGRLSRTTQGANDALNQ